MTPSPFEPRFMKMSVLTAALQELTPRRIRDEDPDRAIEDWLDFAGELYMISGNNILKLAKTP